MYGGTPKAPDPEETAAADFKYSLGSSIASGIINNPNTKSAYGSTKYTRQNTEKVTLPGGEVISVPRYLQTTSLNSKGQNLQNRKDAFSLDLFDSAEKANERPSVAGLPGVKYGYKSTPLSEKFTGPAETMDFSGLISGVDLDKSYAPEDGFSKDRARVEEAVMSRGAELLGDTRESEVARLAAMGLAPGSAKYGRVADQFERSANDLAMQAVLAGGTEQSRLLGEAREAAKFSNEATLDETNTQALLTQLENARRTGDVEKANAIQSLINSARLANTQTSADKARFSNAARGAKVSEREAIKNAEINRLIAIMTGGQVQNPVIPNFSGQGVTAPDYSGLVSSNYKSQVAASNAEKAAIASVLGSGMDLGGTFYTG